MIVSIEEFVPAFPRPMTEDERKRAAVLLGDAEDRIREEFAREGRDFDAELKRVPWLESATRRVIREMVSAVVLVGPDAGRRQYAVTAGAVSESWTMADVAGSAWGSVVLSDEQRRALGLSVGALPRGRFPRPPRWPERPVR